MLLMEYVVSDSSMWSMAGITPQTRGEPSPREKNCVASQKIWTCNTSTTKYCDSYDQSHTLRTSRSCDASSHSSSSSSSRLKSRSRSRVNLSTAWRYSSANSSIKNVEFHRVSTSRGMVRTAHLRASSSFFQAGRSLVDELMMEWASFRSFQGGCKWGKLEPVSVCLPSREST